MNAQLLLGAGLGVAAVAVLGFGYLAATKGLPAALAWAKAKWNAAKNELAKVKGDLVALETRVLTLEQKVEHPLVAAAPAAAPADASAAHA